MASGRARRHACGGKFCTDRSGGIPVEKRQRLYDEVRVYRPPGIVISESTTTSATRNSSNEKSGSVKIGGGIGIFDFLQAASASGSDKFTAKGSASATNRVAGNVTVTISEITPAGNFVLEGTQSIWQNRNEHKITFRGICRPEDISASNTVLSTRVADATVRFDGKGPLNAKQRQGILTQIFNILF